MKILLIEDNEFIRDILTSRLQKKGHTVASADTGEAGLALVRADRPDMLILDLRLADLDGFEIARRLRQEAATADLPILGLSASANTKDREDALAAGFNDFETKPVDFPRLLQKIQALGSRAEGQA